MGADWLWWLLLNYWPLEVLTHWGRVTHICVGKLTNIGSDNGLSPGRRQAIIWTNAGKSLIGPLGTNFSEFLITIHTFSFNKMHLKMLSAKWRPFCLGLNVLNESLNKQFTCFNDSEIVLCMHPANERRRYNVTSSLIGRAHPQNYPGWLMADVSVAELPWFEYHRTLLMIRQHWLLMSWCCQAASHYLNQCWPRSMSGRLICPEGHVLLLNKSNAIQSNPDLCSHLWPVHMASLGHEATMSGLVSHWTKWRPNFSAISWMNIGSFCWIFQCSLP